MTRNIYDAAQVKVLQEEGRVIPSNEAEWPADEDNSIADGYAVVPRDRAVITLDPPFDTREQAETELAELKAMPVPSEQDVDDEAPWPPSS